MTHTKEFIVKQIENLTEEILRNSTFKDTFPSISEAQAYKLLCLGILLVNAKENMDKNQG